MAEATYAPANPGVTGADLFSSGVEQTQSMMSRASSLRQQRQMEQMRSQQVLENAIMLPLKKAQAKADMVKAGTDYQIALNTQESRDGAYKLYDSAATDFNFINQVPDAEVRARLSREWLSRYSQLANVKELEPQVKQWNNLALSNINSSVLLSKMVPAETKAFNALTANMTPDEKAKAAKVKVGLEGRASNAGMKSDEATMPDGSEVKVVFDPRTGRYTVPQVFAADGGHQVSSPTQDNPMVGQGTEAEAQAKEAGRTKAEKAAALPKRQAAVAKIDETNNRLIEDIEALIPQVNALTAGPGGTILGVFPGTSATDLQANLDSIKANAGFEALQAMRDASKTGGALGSITEKELELLQSTLSSFKVGQSPSQLIANLKKARNRIAENSGAARRAFEQEYGSQYGEQSVGKYKVKFVQ